MTNGKQLKTYLLPHIAGALENMDRRRAASLCEIRMHAGSGVEFVFPWGREDAGISLSARQMQDQLAALTGYALYRFESQMAQGYIPLESGCRAGICGRITSEADGTRRMTQVTSICLRISRSVPGAAKTIYPQLTDRSGMPRSVLFMGSPGCGKTTVLRDAAVYLSDTCGFLVAAADEREELFPADRAAARRIDVLSGCKKGEAMILLLRSMSPQVIVCDEIGSAQDADAIEETARCGAAILASAHASDLKNLRKRPSLSRIVSGGVFERYVLLGRMGAAMAVWDSDGDLIWEDDGYAQLGSGSDGDDRGMCRGISAF